MTAEPSHDVLLYARGGGFGHAMRGAALQRLLVERGHRVRLLVEPGSERHLPVPTDPRAEVYCGTLPHALDHASGGFDTLIVDSFPRGWNDEIDDAILARFDHRMLVSRYNRDPDFVSDAARYHRLLNPYPEHLDEWPSPLARAHHTGWLVRPAPMRVVPDDETLVVFDPGGRAPSTLLMRLSNFARSHRLRLRHLRRTEREVRAAKFLCIGAGYNTVYELAHTAADIRFVPLARRFDDQAWRVSRVRRSAGTLADVAAWIAAPVRAQPIVDAPMSPALGPLWSHA